MSINDIIKYNKLPIYNNAYNNSDIQKAYISIRQIKNETFKELLNSFLGMLK